MHSGNAVETKTATEVNVIKIIYECNNFMKGCGFTYAFCGGYALELFSGRKIRAHGDIDITVFEQDRARSIDYVMKKGWNVYEHKSNEENSFLRLISDLSDANLTNLNGVWAIKPGCTLIDIKPKPGESQTYTYKISNKEQLCFDFIEIIFNKQESGNFVFDSFSSGGQYITRNSEKAVLSTDDNIPYLAPEVNLFMNSHPAYLESDYHRAKNILDFNTIAPLLSNESREWFIKALEKAYPGGLERLNRLKSLNV